MISELLGEMKGVAGSMGREFLVAYLEKAPLSGFHYGVLTICSLAYALTGMGIMLISILLSPIKTEWGA